MPDNVLKLGLLLPLSGSWKGGRTIPGAAELAVQRINNDAGLLGGMRVEYVWLDAGFAVLSGNEAIAKLLANKDIDAVVGPGELTCALLCFAVDDQHIDDPLDVVQETTRLASRRCNTPSSFRRCIA